MSLADTMVSSGSLIWSNTSSDNASRYFSASLYMDAVLAAERVLASRVGALRVGALRVGADINSSYSEEQV